MDVFAKLRDKLHSRGDLTFTESDDGIRIDAPTPGGFSVTLTSWIGEDHPEWTIYLGESGFHIHRDDPEEVLEFIAMCFSGECRLREILRGGDAVKAMLEMQTEDGWMVIESYGVLLSPIWREKSERVFRNPNFLLDQRS